jgi:hypothetical protein
MSLRTRGMHLLLAAIATGLSGCFQPSPPPPVVVRTADGIPNQALLDEINADDAWVHVRKTRPIWARRLDSDQTVKTLEGTETVRAGDYLCRGEAGDVWPQKAEDLERKYLVTDEIDDDGWHRYDPRPDAAGALAARVAHSFQVEAKWGTLSGKAGDYVLKNFADADVRYPSDVWIVDQTLFDATYEPVDGP